MFQSYYVRERVPLEIPAYPSCGVKGMKASKAILFGRYMAGYKEWENPSWLKCYVNLLFIICLGIMTPTN